MSDKHDGRYIKVCPICGRSDLFYEMGAVIGMIYHCNNCNYVGPLIVEANEEMIKELKKQYDDQRLHKFPFH